MAAISVGRLGEDGVIQITVTTPGPIGLQFSKRENKHSGLATTEVAGFKRDYERTQAAEELEQLGSPADGSASFKGMLLKSIQNREDGDLEPFYYGMTHGTDQKGFGTKQVAELLNGPVVFELETKQNYEARPHGMHKNWGQMSTEEQAAIRQLGWTESSWQDGDSVPLISTWEELGPAKQLAAESLGYQEADFGQDPDESSHEDVTLLTTAVPQSTPQAVVDSLGDQEADSGQGPDESSDDEDVTLFTTAVPQSTPQAVVDDSAESLDDSGDLFSQPAPEATPTPKQALNNVRQRRAAQHAAEEPGAVGSTDATATAKNAKLEERKKIAAAMLATGQLEADSGDASEAEEVAETEVGSIAGTAWAEYTDDTGTPYFYNTATQESVWEQPPEVKAALAATTSSQSPGERDLDEVEEPPQGKAKMWDDATAEEQKALQVLGYSQSSWDGEEFNIFDQRWASLTVGQKRAAALLGMEELEFAHEDDFDRPETPEAESPDEALPSFAPPTGALPANAGSPPPEPQGAGQQSDIGLEIQLEPEPPTGNPSGQDMAAVDAALDARRRRIEDQKDKLLSQRQRMGDALVSAQQHLECQGMAANSLQPSPDAQRQVLSRAAGETYSNEIATLRAQASELQTQLTQRSDETRKSEQQLIETQQELLAAQQASESAQQQLTGMRAEMATATEAHQTEMSRLRGDHATERDQLQSKLDGATSALNAAD
eukprot:COSAG02_NODE_9120_length_2323_cov_21.291817_1_plen_717_part_10